MPSHHAEASYGAFLYDRQEYYDASIGEILEAKQTGQANTHMLNNLGIMYWEIGKLDEAEKNLREALQLDPANAKAWKNLGLFQEKQGAVESALEAFQKAVQLDPDDYSMNLNNAYLLLELGRASQAIGYFEKAIALGFNNDIVSDHLAQAYEISGNDPKAKLYRALSKQFKKDQ